MQFLKTLFWVVVAVVIALFAFNNWTPVSVDLGTGLRLDTKLPVLVVGAFVIGFLPLYLWHRTVIWRQRRRILTLEAQTASANAASVTTPVHTSTTPTALDPVPPPPPGNFTAEPPTGS